MNRKGFMMAELVVVSSIVLVTLVGLYTSYNKIYSTYKTRLTYYDATTLYRLGYYRDILKENNVLSEVIDNSKSGIVEVYNYNNTEEGNIFALPEIEQPKNVADVVFFINNNGGKLDADALKAKNIHPTFNDYIEFFNNSVDYTEFNYVMIMERCLVGDENNCNYAYLEIPEIPVCMPS